MAVAPVVAVAQSRPAPEGGGEAPAKGAQDGRPGGLSAELMYRLLVGDVALQRGDPSLAARAYFEAAREAREITGQPVLKARINDEAIAENGDENLNLAGIADIQNEHEPRMISFFPLPLPPEEMGIKNFYEKGGRFGPHNTNLEYHLPDVEKQAVVRFRPGEPK